MLRTFFTEQNLLRSKSPQALIFCATLRKKMGGAPSHVLQESLIQGGSDVLNSKEWFEEKGITHVVSVCEMTPSSSITSSLSNHMHINIEDLHSSDLSQYFEETTLFIHRARSSGGRVYVHCAAGTHLPHFFNFSPKLHLMFHHADPASFCCS